MSAVTLFRQTAWTVYQAALCLGWPALWLYYFCRSRTDGRYRNNYRSRMGLELPPLLASRRDRVWIHALSVGETLSAVPLIAKLKVMRPSVQIIFSTATETGMSIAVQRLAGLADIFFFMPHDFLWSVHSVIKRIRPSMFVLIETDFWPNIIRALNSQGIRTVLVNARMSPASLRGYSRLGLLAGVIFGGFDLIFTQTELDRERFIALQGTKKEIIACGNLKFESAAPVVAESGIASIRSEMGLGAGRVVWVAGSTHEGEEQIVLRIHRNLVSQFPDLLVVVAPRKAHRGAEIANLAGRFGFECGVRSKGEKSEGKAVYVLDTLGELARIYSICDIAFLGGSFVRAGGHNPLEAVAQGKPACWGPHFFNFSEIEEELLAAKCARRVSSEKELTDFLRELLGDNSRLSEMKEAARNFAVIQRNASNQMASILLERLV